MRSSWPFLILLAVAAAAAGCFLTIDDILGKGCRTNQDCPANYACLPMLADGGLTCTAQYPYQPDSGQPDSGPAFDAGAPDRTYFYCTDVMPILNLYCMNNCHGAPPGGSVVSGCASLTCVGSPGPFSLDNYDGGAGVGGAYQERDRIKTRVYDLQTMPPAGSTNPSQQDRQILAWWDEQGGQFCDAGTGGVSFALQIQTIFANDCVGCHAGATPAGGMDLSTGNSYANIVNVPCNCDAGPGVFRIKPNDTANSMMWRKTGNVANECGASMPKGQTPLSVMSPAEYQQITNWINAGAPNN